MAMNPLLPIIFVLLFHAAHAEPLPPATVGKTGDINLFEHLSYWVDSTGHAPDSKIPWNRPGQFRPAKEGVQWVPKKKFGDMAVWIKFEVTNPSPDPQNYWLQHYDEKMGYMSGYTIQKTALYKVDGSRLDRVDRGYQTLDLRIVVPPKSTMTFVAYEQHTIMWLDSNMLCLDKYHLFNGRERQRVWLDFFHDRVERFYLHSFFMGVLLMIAFASIILFVALLDYMYLYYTFYVLVTLTSTWSFFESEHYFVTYFIAQPIRYTGITEVIWIYSVTFFYLLVTKSLLEKVNDNPKVIKFLEKIIPYFAVLAIVNTMIYIFFYTNRTIPLEWLGGSDIVITGDHSVYSIFNYIIRIVSQIFGVYILYHFWRIGGRLGKMVVIGGIGLLVGVVVGFWMWILGPWPFVPATIQEDPTTWVLLGVVWDLVFYSAALISARFQVARDEGEILRYQWLSDRLDAWKRGEDMYITKMKLHKLRIAPHFLGNTLAGIKRLADTQGSSKQVREYLDGFADMMRLIWVYSQRTHISLSKEIKSLETYLKLEQMLGQSGAQFVFHKEIAPGIDLDNVNVPPIILQPYAENSIRHGFNQGGSHFNIYLRVFEQDDRIHIVMEDDGIGRGASKRTLFVRRDEKKRPSSMVFTKESIERRGGTVIVEDLKDDSGKARGTRVVISFPVDKGE
jgi:two-component sensor histidine kinase